MTNIELNQILSKFNFLFNLRYKAEIADTPSTSSSSFYKSVKAGTEDVEYINSSHLKKYIHKKSGLFYLSPISDTDYNEERVNVIKKFYKNFLIFYQNITNKKFRITNKKEFCETILKIPITQKILRFIKNLWVLFSNSCKVKSIHTKNLSTTSNMNIDKISNELLERFELSLSHLAKKNKNINDFELHKAVYENNLRLISRILGSVNKKSLNNDYYIYCDVNEPDVNNNTPLLLALKLNNADVVRVLCDHGADINLKIYDDSISPLEYALRHKMKKFLKIFVNTLKKKRFAEFEKNKMKIFNTIKEIPNFQVELKLNFDSNILNIFSSLTACDCYKISKMNDNVRIDMNVNRNNEFKGKNSLIIKGDEFKIVKVDHTKKISYDYIEALLSDNDEEKKVEKLLKEGKTKTKVFIDDINIVEEKEVKEIMGYQCRLNKMKGNIFIQKEIIKDIIIDEEEENDLKIRYPTFDDYFNKKNLDNININRRDSSKTMIAFERGFEDDYEKYERENAKTESNKNPTKKNIKINKKQLDMSIWLCKDFPLTIQNFMPLVHILSIASGDFSQLENTLLSKFLPFTSFPLKISFPLGMSFHALLSISSFTLNDTKLSNFQIDYNYSTSSVSESSVTANGNNFYADYYKEKRKCSSSNEEEDDCVIREFRNKKQRTDLILSKNSNTNSSASFFHNYCRTFNETKIKKIPNNEKDLTNLSHIPHAPKRRMKESDLERQNTIKCMIHLKISPSILLRKSREGINYNLKNEDILKKKIKKEPKSERVKMNNSLGNLTANKNQKKNDNCIII